MRQFHSGKLINLLLGLVLCLGSGSAAARRAQPPFPLRSVQSGSLTQIAMRDAAAFYGLRQTVRDKTVLWSGPGAGAEFTVDRRNAQINGVQVNLSHAVALHEREPVISESDFRLLIDPILRARALPRQRVMTVVIDPGHGGRDPGAAGRQHEEKKVVLQIALRLGQILRQQGFRVHLTRTTDQYLSMEQRVEVARRSRADLFVSIHANAAANQSVHGVETFLLPPRGTAGTYTNRVLDTHRAGNAFDKQNLRLAYEIQRHALARTRASDRGVKHATFQVLRDLPCPGVLIETGFMSNPREEQMLANPAYQTRIAAGIAAGIVAYRDLVAPR